MGTHVRGWKRSDRAADDPYLISAAVDVGSSSSCYAFCYRTAADECDIRMNKNWAEKENFESYKAPTAVLTEPGSRGKFLSFGYEAEREYKKLTDEGQTTDKNLYHDFKMILYTEKNLDETRTKVTSTSGTRRPLMDVFVMTLKYLRQHMLDAIRETGASLPRNNEIRWVITVPAIWSEAAKLFMRKAACRAGLMEREQSSQLLIVLEPSAAALYCRQQEANHFTGGPEAFERDGLQFPVGMKYLVVDAGGGTVDFTSQEKIDDENVKELMVSRGGDWGGREVDQQFIQLLKQALGDGFIDRFSRECALQWFDFMSSFEKTKKGIDVDGKGFSIPISFSFGMKYAMWTQGDITQKLSQCKASLGIYEANGYLLLTPEATINLFNPVLQKVLGEIRTLRSAGPLRGVDLSYIFLVGGFSSCKLMQKYIKEATPGTTVLTPYDAQTTIIKGAVLYCNKPDVVKRLAKKTYGVATYAKFDEKIHDPNRMSTEGSFKFCRDVFLPFVTKGEIIDIGVEGNMIAEPVKANADSVVVSFYSFDEQIKLNETTLYIDSPDVQQVGTVRVQLSEAHKEAKLSFFFGDEVRVTATNEGSGQPVETTLKFEFSEGN